MEIVSTSTGPALRDDDGFIIMPSDAQGLLHAATSSPQAINDLVEDIRSRVTDGLTAFSESVVVTAEGQINLDFEDLEETVQRISSAVSAASLMNQMSRILLSNLVPKPVSTRPPADIVLEETLISFPPGYAVASVPVLPGVLVRPVSYYPSVEIVPAEVRQGALEDRYEIFLKESDTSYRRMSNEELAVSLGQ